MKWSELPQEYKDLEKGFDYIISDSDFINLRFDWESTPQGYYFWLGCAVVDSINELPKIPTE
jgi:hypothetical protein